MRRAVLLAMVLLTGGVAHAGPESTHTGVVRTKRLEVRFRPGSRAAADADRQAAAAERDLDRIAQALDATPKGPFVLWIYDDPWELAQATGTEGTGGFSSGNASHVPYDNDQTRTHELVHIVTHEWPKSGPERRNLFVVEGIANAVLEFVSGVHVHAVAAHYRKAGRLPALSEMLEAPDFYAWLRSHPGLNAYDVAASWMRFLLDTYGTAKTKRFYTGTTARVALGLDIEGAEKKWHAMLDAYPLRPEVETLLRQRAGEHVFFTPLAEGVPTAIMAKPEQWTPLLGRALSTDQPDRWAMKATALSAANDADDWIACNLGEERYGDCAVLVRVSTTGYTPVQVRFGPANQVMFVQPGTFLYRGNDPIASDPAVSLPLSSARREIVVARRGRRIDVWVDGRRALATDQGTEGPLPVGVGIHKGAAVFEEIRVRPL